MATVSGSSKKAANTEDWESLTISKAGNGFIVSKYLPVKGNGFKSPPPPYLATAPGEVLDYLEKCLGKREHDAHEAAEEKSEKSESKGY